MKNHPFHPVTPLLMKFLKKAGFTFHVSFAFLLSAQVGLAGLEVSDLGKQYDPPAGRVPSILSNPVSGPKVAHGNTSLRNETRDTLELKGAASPNGYGYYQRNRDLGQVINIPEGKDVKLDAIVLRTSKGNNAVMQGAPGAAVYVQLLEVQQIKGETIRINDNGTPVGTPAKHGFDVFFSRCDDFVEGERFLPLRRATGGILPASLQPTTQPAHPSPGKQHGEQEGHLRYLRWDLAGEDEWVLEGGKRYALMFGFEEPGRDRGLALAVSTKVHEHKAPAFVTDSKGAVRWGIRREGDGSLPPTMIDKPEEPTDPELIEKLKNESMFAPRHWETLSPTSDGYPDVDTYRTLEFYIETTG